MNERFSLTYKTWGEAAILIEWPPVIKEEILYDIRRVQKLVEEKLYLYIIEVIPAYNSLTLFVRNDELKLNDIITKVAELNRHKKIDQKVEQKIWHLPVCYDPSFGIDLDQVAERSKVSVEQIVKLHSQTLYIVYFIGFLPGFMYLGGLPEVLHTPRLSSPRAKVIKGAVAIGGGQTGIYPQETPGGWNIIGNCPINFLDLKKDPPVFSSAGDRVKFFPIDKKEHDRITEEIRKDVFRIKMEVTAI